MVRSAADRRKRDFYAANVLGMASFLVVSILVAPLLHESAHMALLDYLGCPYLTEIDLSSDYGVQGKLEPACDMSKRETVYVLGAGVLVNLALAAALFMAASLLHLRCMLTHANYIMYVALGFLMDPLFYSFAMEGDVVNVLAVIGRQEWAPLVPILGTALFALAIAYYYFYTESFMEDYLRIEQEVARAEAFVSRIKG